MSLRSKYLILNKADGGTGGTGGTGTGSGGGAGSTNDDDDDVAAQIKAAVDQATSGLVAKNKQLLGELKTLKDHVGGLDLDKAKQLLSKFDDDEDAELISKGKIEEFLSKKYAKRDADWQKKLQDAIDAKELSEQRAKKFLDLVLDGRLREAFDGKVDPRSMKAALLEAKQIFTLNDDGLAVQVSDNGVVLGKDGKTPFSPKEWIDSDIVRSESPYLFPATATGTGGKNGPNGDSFSADTSKMTPVQKMSVGRNV